MAWDDKAAMIEMIEIMVKKHMEKAMFEVGKTYKTRDGRDARVICTDRNYYSYPIIALVKCIDGTEECRAFHSDGRVDEHAGMKHDLIPPLLPITPGRYKTRDGRNARVFCTDVEGGNKRVFGLIADTDGGLIADTDGERGQKWYTNGSVWQEGECYSDLVERIGDL